jgi:glutathione S-transferase
MDRVPLFNFNGTTIGQSKTIERFVAKKFGFMGTNEIEEALIDMLTEHVRDIKQKYNDSKSGKSGDELATAKSNFISSELPKWAQKLEKCVGKEGFSVGSKLSLADITIQQLFQDYFDDKEGAAASIEPLPGLSAIVANVAAAASNWFSTRPSTPF